MFSAVDVYTRYAFSYPIKNKNESSCEEALKKLLKDVKKVYPDAKIQQFDSDNEPSFLSGSFKKICKDNGIKQNLLPVTEQHATGIIERFNRTTREWINKYKVAYNTANWENVVPDFIHNYNNSVHSTIKTTPALAVSNSGLSGMSSYIYNQTLKASKQDFNKHELEVGTKVRLKIKRALFEKRTKEQFTKTIHTITEFRDGKFYVNDRVNGYSKEELLQVDKSIDREIISEETGLPRFASQEEKDDLENEIQTRQIDRRVQRRINKEGIEQNEQALRRSARERKPNQLEDVRYGKISY
jgi:Integrase core domain